MNSWEAAWLVIALWGGCGGVGKGFVMVRAVINDVLV